MVEKELKSLPPFLQDERLIKTTKEILKSENKSIREMVKKDKSQVR